MLSSAILAFNQLFTKPYRSVLWRMLGITLLLLVLVCIGVEAGISYLLTLEDYLPLWAEIILKTISALIVIVSLWFLIIPVSAIVASLYLDEVCRVTEQTHYPKDPKGRDLPVGEAIIQTIRFLGVVIIVNLFVLLMIPIVGLGVPLFFIANGYLLGREYFEQAALRFRSPDELKELRARHGAKIFIGGLLIAGFIAIPVLNLLTPIFATAYMVHVHKKLTGSRPQNIQ